MLSYILRLPTARAALLALVGALLVFLRQTGIAVPANLDHTIGIVIDVVLSFITLLGSLSVMHRAQPPSTPPPAPPKGLGAMMLVLLVTLLATGCAGRFEEARGPSVRLGASPELSARCISLDDGRRAWGGTAKGSGFLAGATGIAMIPVHDARAEVGLAIGTVALGATAVTSVFVAESLGESWARECSQ